MASNFDSFITADLVMQARKATDIEPYGPLLVDPAGRRPRALRDSDAR